MILKDKNPSTVMKILQVKVRNGEISAEEGFMHFGTYLDRWTGRNFRMLAKVRADSRITLTNRHALERITA